MEASHNASLNAGEDEKGCSGRLLYEQSHERGLVELHDPDSLKPAKLDREVPPTPDNPCRQWPNLAITSKNIFSQALDLADT